MVGTVGALLILGRILAFLYVEVLWFREVGYSSVFWRRTAWFWGTRLVAGLGVGILLLLNLRLVSRTLGGIQIKRRFGDLEISEQMPRSYVFGAILGVSSLLGVWFGASVPESLGLQVLLSTSAPAWGITEPLFGRDLSFYVFLLPLLRTAVTFSLIVVFLLFTVCTAGYAATGSARWGRAGLIMGDLPRVHLGAIVASFLLLLAVRLWLGRSMLLLYGNSEVQDIFGYADAEARLPALRTMAVLLVVAAGVLLWGAWQNRAIPVLVSGGAVVLGWLLVVNLYPSLVQRFRVEPNELDRESRYIQLNMDFTRLGFGLHELGRRRFEYAPTEPIDWELASRQIEGLPLWPQNVLLAAYRQREARFRYYDFDDVTIDHYATADGPLPVALSVREVDPGGIEDPNWQNLHLRERYLTGMGAVASAANRRSAQGQPAMLLSGIPPEFNEAAGVPPGLQLERAAVFFGARPQSYAILNPSDSTFLAPDSTAGRPGIDYPEGIVLSSPWRVFSFAWNFREPNMLFAAEVEDESRVVFRRQVVERANAIAPFFRYPEAPYPVVAGGRIVWILEGFTATRAFPLSSTQELNFRNPVAYARNSVKITVDAITGAVAFYRLPVVDPLLEAYERAFPELLRPFDEMPAELRPHVRYPRALLSLQAQVLLQYHQETPARFHGQQDVWAIPNEISQGETQVPYRPEYGLYRLPDEEQPHFFLTTAFVPVGRQNLTAVLAGRIRAEGNAELILLDVPVQDQVPGPRQVEAVIEQDPLVSQTFSLWRQGGSQVWSGHLHLVPVGNQLLYGEAIFLAAEADAIPALERFILSDGRRVTMQPTVEEAIAFFAGTPLRPEGHDPDAAFPDVPGATQTDRWPREALDLLRQADQRLRDGDFSGFGTALRELRQMLESIAAAGGAPPSR